MKLILPIAALLMAAPALLAQPSAVVVEPKRTHGYDTRIAISSTQSIMGQEIGMSLDAIGIAELVADRITATGIEWSVGFPALSIKAESPMMARAYDTTVRVAPVAMRTRADGTLETGAGVATNNPQVDMLLSQGLGSTFWGQFFSPTIAAKADLGGSWESRIDDTVAAEDVGMSLRRSVTTRYTFEAMVDTLGARAMRVRLSAPAITIAGELQAQGMPMTIAGDGSSAGTFYYDATSGMLLAGSLDSELSLNATINAGTKLVVPVTFASTHSMTRSARGGE